jgi:hypothetical protein
MDITITRKNTVILTLIFFRKENFDRKEIFILSPQIIFLTNRRRSLKTNSRADP